MLTAHDRAHHVYAGELIRGSGDAMNVESKAASHRLAERTMAAELERDQERRAGTRNDGRPILTANQVQDCEARRIAHKAEADRLEKALRRFREGQPDGL
ncbi:MAG TPA: hypothetical protein VD931_06490 [Baekduia sp.]|nr:hypothetical protein [Baekduia sp.]